MMAKLTAEKCVPCEGGIPPFAPERIAELLPEVPGWKAVDDHHLFRRWEFDDFKKAQAFADSIGELAEKEGHHPDIRFGWGYLEATLFTHAIKGLSRNDFILAAKIDALGRRSKLPGVIDMPDLEGEVEHEEETGHPILKSVALGLGGLTLGFALGATATPAPMPPVCTPAPTVQAQIPTPRLTPAPTPRPTPPSTPVATATPSPTPAPTIDPGTGDAGLGTPASQ
jgi:4a-hydroxytetrahydrobiopterin dehydratase